MESNRDQKKKTDHRFVIDRKIFEQLCGGIFMVGHFSKIQQLIINHYVTKDVIIFGDINCCKQKNTTLLQQS